MTIRRTFLKLAIVATGLAAVGFGPAIADELDTLKEKGTIRIAMSGAYPPFNFVNDETRLLALTQPLAPRLPNVWALKLRLLRQHGTASLADCWQTNMTQLSVQ